MDGREGPTLEEIEEYNFVVNQTFRSEAEFYEFYNNYAEGKGFSVRKDNVRKRPGTDEVIWRRFLCSCEGFRSMQYFESMDRQRQPRALTRCGCPARLDVQMSERGGTWYIMDVMEKSHGGPGGSGFLLQDLYNFIARVKKEKIEGSDAEYVLNYMEVRREENPEFYFKYSTDDEGRLQNIFWSDSQSQIDFGAFGDVVVFDSTYRVNRYNLPWHIE
ncbi:hypothetical protein ACP70R_037540 [Stipagrostis hirtigluma subsp. patula]